MSLDIAITHKVTGETRELNWLRNQYGLCNWAEDNYHYATMCNNYNHAPDNSRYKLHYVINHWAYKSSSAVNRPLFKKIVDQYAEVILGLDKGYYFFDTSSFIQFVLPHWNLIPRYTILNTLEVVGSTREDSSVYIGHRMGFNIEWFNHSEFNLREDGSMLQAYKDWFLRLVEFAELLQDKNYRFYCSN